MVDYAYGRHNHHKGIFFVATILTIGLCSVFPMMCFKGFSSKERARQKAKAEEIKAKQAQRDAEDDLDMVLGMAPRMVGDRGHPPPTRAHTPHHRRRRSSSPMPRDRRDSQRFEEETRSPQRRFRSHSRHAYDRQLDRER
jgi:hypothetical protein